MIKKIALISFLILSLILVRVFQYDIFYDPLLNYFKNSYLNEGVFPEINWMKMTLFLFFRFFINSTISLTIIYIIFKDVELIKISIILFIAAFIILTPIYYHYINIEFEGGYLAGFYIRRFLIQPLLLFLLVPAFYYQKMLQEE